MSLQLTQELLGRTQNRLATGRKVNSALDDTNAFFASQALNNRAGDYSRLLDGVGQDIQIVKNAQTGLEAISNLLEQAEAIALDTLATGDYSAPTAGPVLTLNDQIVASNPDIYWRLNETGGTTANNSGSAGGINGTYQAGTSPGGTPIIPNGGEVTGTFNGTGLISIPDSAVINTTVHAERTIELTFNANSTGGRQVLYEEGGTVNALNIYIENGNLFINGRDSGDWGPFNIASSVVPGRTYHATLVLDQPNGEFRGYVDGALIGTGVVTTPLATHTGNIGIGGMNQDSFFSDGPQSGNGFFFDGQIAEVALYNRVLSDTEISDHALAVSGPLTGNAATLDQVITGVNDIAQDSGYRGQNLLIGDLVRTTFNEDDTSATETIGEDFTSIGLGLDTLSLENEAATRASLVAIRSALAEVRRYSGYLNIQTSVISSRDTFIRNVANILQEGSDKLTLADMNEEGANSLALSTRQSLGITALSISAESQGSILQLF